jgi:hypothetical protein
LFPAKSRAQLLIGPNAVADYNFLWLVLVSAHGCLGKVFLVESCKSILKGEKDGK